MHHTLDRTNTCNRWNRAYPPRLKIAPGDTLSLQMKDSSDGQVTPGMTLENFAAMDMTRVHALTGPVEIEGAEPGDALEIEVLDLRHEGWAWTSIIPGLGLLADDFTRHFLHIWKLEENCTRSIPGVTLDLHPFCGIIGVQRAEVGEFRTRAPGAFGGNMDVRQLGVGAFLLLPVFASGAGLCVGDAHAAQGDGEVSINGMEAPMTVTLRVGLRKRFPLTGPYALTSPALLPLRYTTKPFHVFIESHEDPREACRAAVGRALSYLEQRLSLSQELALILCSVVLDLKISQLVNAPLTTISAFLPEAIFDSGDHRGIAT
jgi:acetamidase/formamidase